MRATTAGAVIGRVLNEPDTMVACGSTLPTVEEGISEAGPGVDSGAAGGATEVGTEPFIPVDLSDTDAETGMCGWAMVFVGLSETQGTSVSELAEQFASTSRTVEDPMGVVQQSLEGLNALSLSTTQIADTQSVMAFLRSSRAARVADGVSLKNVFTDRVAASVDVLAPLVVADEVDVDVLRGATSPDLTVGLGSGGTFSVEGDDASIDHPLMSVDAEGNAFFAGTITARSITVEGADSEAIDLTSVNDAITFLTSQVDAFALALNTSSETWGSQFAALNDRFVSLETLFAANTTALNDLTTRVTALEAPEAVADTGLNVAGNFSVSGITTFGGMLYVNAIGSIGDLLSFIGDIRFIGTPYFNSDTAGFAVIHAGDTSVDVSFVQAYRNQPIVQANVSFELPADDASRTAEESAALMARLVDAQTTYLTSNTRYVVTNKSVNGFTIVLNAPAATDLPFSWTAFAVQDVRTLESTTNRIAPESIPAVPAPAVFEDPAPSEGGSNNFVEPTAVDGEGPTVPTEGLEPAGASEMPATEVLDVPVEAVQDVAPEPSPAAPEPSSAVDTAPAEG